MCSHVAARAYCESTSTSSITIFAPNGGLVNNTSDDPSDAACLASVGIGKAVCLVEAARPVVVHDHVHLRCTNEIRVQVQTHNPMREKLWSCEKIKATTLGLSSIVLVSGAANIVGYLPDHLARLARLSRRATQTCYRRRVGSSWRRFPEERCEKSARRSWIGYAHDA